MGSEEPRARKILEEEQEDDDEDDEKRKETEKETDMSEIATTGAGPSCHATPAPRNESQTPASLVSGSLCYNTYAANVENYDAYKLLCRIGERHADKPAVAAPAWAGLLKAAAAFRDNKNGRAARHHTTSTPAILDDHIALPARGGRYVSST